MSKSSNPKLFSFGAALVGDVASAMTAIPGGGILGKLADEHLARRQETAIAIAIEELRKGNADFQDEDAEPFVGILLRYSKAAAEGASRKNLRLLMQVVCGLKRNKALRTDLFARWAGILEHLSRDELMLVGHAIRIQQKKDQGIQGIDENFWPLVQEAMKDGKYAADEIPSIGASVSRYGLIVPVSAWGSLNYQPSPWLRELAKLVETETLLGEDD